MPEIPNTIFRLNPKTFSTFNTSPVDLLGGVDLQPDRIAIDGTARYQDTRWCRIGARTPPIQSLSFGLSVKVTSSPEIGTCSVKILNSKDIPVIGLTYYFDCSSHPYSSDRVRNVFLGFGQDASGHRTQILEKAPPESAGSYQRLQLSYDAQAGQLSCSVGDYPLHYVRARLEQFKLEFSFDVLGVASDYHVLFEDLYISSVDGCDPAVPPHQASSKRKVFQSVSKEQPASIELTSLPKLASTTVLVPTQEVQVIPQETRILFLAAEPVDQTRLYIHRELHTIQGCLRATRKPIKLFMQPSTLQADILQALLDVRPHIVHFAGHGTLMGELCFETLDGRSDPAPAEYLSRLFEPFAHDLKCVVLNACYSETQAQSIAIHVPIVIGIKKSIVDEAAIVFSQGFYTGLAAGKPVEVAFELGRNEISRINNYDVMEPVLIKKQG